MDKPKQQTNEPSVDATSTSGAKSKTLCAYLVEAGKLNPDNIERACLEEVEKLDSFLMLP